MTIRLITLGALIVPLALTACQPRDSQQDNASRAETVGDTATAAEGVKTGYSVSQAKFVQNIIGFNGPESVRYDADQDVYFVSNMMGYGSLKDGLGYIS